MIFKEESQLLQNIKLGHLYRVYLLYGEEKYLKEMYLKRLIRLAAPEEFESFNLHRFDGGDLDVDALLDACEAMPFLAEQRCVVVDKFDFEGLSAKDREKISALLEDPPETTVLILVVDKEEFLPKKSAAAKKLVALCDKGGAVLELKKRSGSDLTRFVRSKLESRGCTITKDNCDLLIERCEKDMLTLSGELEKIGAYAQGKYGADAQHPVAVTATMIEEVTCKTVSASVYDLSRAILADRFEKAMRILEDLIYLRYQPTAILAALSGAYLDLYIARTAKNMGQGEDAIKQNFSYKGRDFVVRNSLRDCAKYPLEVLQRSVIYLAQTDLRMKSTRADNNLLLEQAVTELFLIASGQKQ
ncbi:DNA polymerase III subunit delta [uncultured Negativibacillus sp.]|uniref:DNA polymerase III subunit delta n=1 Tax=uncultured Negativibacillus sp. TaxID=1980696 RepID=UPI0025E4C6FF|nr:DNA polymerase III subunit delta [uncultured Negativibacillus sp.]